MLLCLQCGSVNGGAAMGLQLRLTRTCHAVDMPCCALVLNTQSSSCASAALKGARQSPTVSHLGRLSACAAQTAAHHRQTA